MMIGRKSRLRVGPAEPGIAIGRPLHRSADSVAIAQVNVVSHADLVAIVDDRSSRQREQQAEHQLDPSSVIAQERGQPVPDAQVDARRAILGISSVHIIAFFVGHHLQRQLVVVPQEQAPLAGFRDGAASGP